MARSFSDVRDKSRPRDSTRQRERSRRREPSRRRENRRGASREGRRDTREDDDNRRRERERKDDEAATRREEEEKKQREEIAARRLAAQKKEAEEQQRRREEAALVRKLLPEMIQVVEDVGGWVGIAQETAQVALENDGLAWTRPDEIVDAVETAERKLESISAAFEFKSHFIGTKQKEMGENDAARKVRKEIGELQARVAIGQRALDEMLSSLNFAKQKNKRKLASVRKQEERKEQFAKLDVDNTGRLTREDVLSFSRAVYGFELTDDVIGKIMRTLEPIVFEKFHLLNVKIGLAITTSQARVKREQKQALQQVVDGIDEVLGNAKSIVVEVETTLTSLEGSNDSRASSSAMKEAVVTTEATTTKVPKGSVGEQRRPGRACSSVMKEAVVKTEATTRKAEDLLSKASAQIEQVERNTLGGKEGLRLRHRHDRMRSKLKKVLDDMKEKIERREYAEVEELRDNAIHDIRSFMATEGKDGEQLFAHIAQNSEGVVSREQFFSFIKKFWIFAAEGKADIFFKHIVGDASVITEQQFLELIQCFYHCVKFTVVTEDVSIKSTTVRKLEVGEVLQPLEKPIKDDANIQRVRCLCVSDGATGWATICGNQGTPFLELGGNIFECVRETKLTCGSVAQEAELIRCIDKGEIIEVAEFPKNCGSLDVKRVRGRAKRDGATGWITMCDEQGTVFLKIVETPGGIALNISRPPTDAATFFQGLRAPGGATGDDPTPPWRTA